jgi:hypothetical protein
MSASVSQLPVNHPSSQEFPAMRNNNPNHSSAWVSFTYVSFGVALFLVAAGIFFMPVDIWIKGYLGMGVALLLQSSVTLTKTLRDVHEGDKLVNRIEDARTEKLLMDVQRPAA